MIRMRSGLQASDRPGRIRGAGPIMQRTSPAGAVVDSKFALDPEFHGVRPQAKTTPVGRPRHLHGDLGGFGCPVRHREFQIGVPPQRHRVRAPDAIRPVGSARSPRRPGGFAKGGCENRRHFRHPRAFPPDPRPAPGGGGDPNETPRRPGGWLRVPVPSASDSWCKKEYHPPAHRCPCKARPEPMENRGCRQSPRPSSSGWAGRHRASLAPTIAPRASSGFAGKGSGRVSVQYVLMPPLIGEW